VEVQISIGVYHGLLGVYDYCQNQLFILYYTDLKIQFTEKQLNSTYNYQQYIFSLSMARLCDYHCGGRRDRGRMVVGFTTTFAISAYHN